MSIYEVELRGNPTEVTADIVAIHGLYEGPFDTWTDPSTSVFWLRDLLDVASLKARVLVYEYRADAFASVEQGSADRILPQASTLIANLQANREEIAANERPIIFICHGLGGILVKKALFVSSQSVSRYVRHRRSIYTSTYAILFLGTPHMGMGKEAEVLRKNMRVSNGPSQFLTNLISGSEALQEISDQFAPLMKRFVIHCYWEQKQTTVGQFKGYFVDPSSAAPAWDDVNRSGIMADHSHMCKFSSKKDQGFKVVVGALRRAVLDGPDIIESRWNEEWTQVADERDREALEAASAAESIRNRRPSASPSVPSRGVRNEYFLGVPKSASSLFTGQTLLTNTVKEKFLDGRHLDGRRQHRIFVIYGLGGSGKTQFCLKFVEDYRENFWGIFWVDASSEKNAETGFAYFGREARRDSTMEAGRHWLSEQVDPWLLIIDNADDPAIDVSRYFPAGGRGHILITTQNPTNTEHATVGEFRCHGLEEEDAVTLLLKAAHDPGAQNEGDNQERRQLAKPIVSKLGYLALAIIQAGAAIRKKLCTLEEYLPRFMSQRKEMQALKNTESLDDYKLTIITTWEVPLQRIRFRNSISHTDAIEILHLLAFMHFEQIPMEIFFRAWANIQSEEEIAPKIKSSTLQATWAWLRGEALQEYPDVFSDRATTSLYRFQRRLRAAIVVLHEHSLVEFDFSKEMCSMHPVVHSWVRDRLNQLDRQKWLASATSIIAKSVSKRLEASGRNFRRMLEPHINACLQIWKNQYRAITHDNKRAGEVLKFASVLAENGQWRQASDLQQTVAEFRMSTLGKEHDGTLEALEALGQTCWDLSEADRASRAREIIYAARLKRHGPDNIGVLIAMDDLTHAYWLAGNLTKSKDFGEQTVDGMDRILGRADPHTLNAKFNLGRTYLHLRELDKAVNLLVIVRNKRKHFFGENHPDSLLATQELAMVYSTLKKLPKAEFLLREVLEARKQILGEEHAYTLWSVNDLAKVVCDQGHALEAIDMLEAIVPVVARTLGESHVGMSMTKGNLARAYMASRNWSAAKRLLLAQVQNQQRTHPDWITTVTNLGYVCVQQGNMKEGEEYCKDAVETIMHTKVLNLEHPKSKRVVKQLVDIYVSQGRHEDARMVLQRVGKEPDSDEPAAGR